MTLEVGRPAPDFALESDRDGQVSLAALRGGPVVLYFYPRDNTPGCTTEACDFRDRMERLRAAGATVVGVSRDSLPSHARFRAKYDLDFPLLSDPEGQVHQLFGAWGEKNLYGRKSVGPIRTTVLIDGEGTVRRVWSRVKVKGHADAVLEALESL